MRNSWDVDLIIDMRDGGDWSLDLLFAGLVQNLGPENVLMVPRRWKHTEWQGVIDGRVTPDWGLERRTLGFTPFNRFVRDHGDHEGHASMLAGMGRIRRIWLDERMESFQKYRELGLDKCGARVVVVAGHDRFWNHSPEFVASLYGDRLEAMLLDNWYDRYTELPFRTKRIGWSCNFDHYWQRPTIAPEKDIDISFIGYNSHPDRAKYIDFITKRFHDLKTHIVLECKSDSFENFLPKSEYFDIIQRSKIALNLRGAADRGKTMRAYEIPYVGSFMLSQTIDDPGMTDDFQDLTHCVYFSSAGQLERQIEWFLGIDTALGEGHRECIALAGHQRAAGPLSVKNRWMDVIKWLQDG